MAHLLPSKKVAEKFVTVTDFQPGHREPRIVVCRLKIGNCHEFF